MSWLSCSIRGRACGGVAVRYLKSCVRHLSARPTPHLDLPREGPESAPLQSTARSMKRKRQKPICLPDDLVAALQQAVVNFPTAELEQEAIRLNHWLSARHPPTEESVIQATAEQLQQEYVTKHHAVSDRKLRKHVIREMKKRIYHWQPMALTTDHEAAVYAVARMAIDYAGVVFCLRQIALSDPGFSPSAVLHYGSGAGAGLWAARHVWGADTVREFLGVEWRHCLLELAVLLLRGGTADGPLDTRALFRPLLPPSTRLKYPLILSSHALCELPSQQARLETVSSLWDRTAPGGSLCIIEAGSNTGYLLMLEARDLVLRLSRQARTPVHVSAPCPHELACPRFSHSLTPCHFMVSHEPLTLRTVRSTATARTPVSYVTLVKADRPQQDRQWPRVVQQVLARPRHSICRLCTNRGMLEEVVVTKKRHDREVYSRLRAAQWGDTLPITLEHPEQGTVPE